MHQKTAPEGAFLQIMPHGVAQVNAATSNNARLVYQPQRAIKTALLSKSPHSGIGYRVSGIGYRYKPPIILRTHIQSCQISNSVISIQPKYTHFGYTSGVVRLWSNEQSKE
jgi:hypothetical protein